MLNFFNPTLPPIHLFTFKDIPFRISRAWNIFVLAIGLIGAFYAGLPGFFAGLAVILTAYFFVSVHEYGHALTAKHMGVRCDHITLWPFAGLASIDISHDDPRKEWWVTFNGPLTNAIWCVLFYPLTVMLSYSPDLAILGMLIGFCFQINLVLLIFNLIPVHPMDGGRLFRSGIQILFGVAPLKAAKITAYVSIGTAIVGSIVAFQLGYTMVGFMLPMAALMGWQEYQRAIQRGQHRVQQQRFGAGGRAAPGEQGPRMQGGEYDEQGDLIDRTNNALDAVEEMLRRRR
tara:strand:+ start:7239 stop:8102 length:864 start_codon:yes stop_codon:yes gene_type:complete